jgi:hypothetical protein
LNSSRAFSLSLLTFSVTTWPCCTRPRFFAPSWCSSYKKWCTFSFFLGVDAHLDVYSRKEKTVQVRRKKAQTNPKTASHLSQFWQIHGSRQLVARQVIFFTVDDLRRILSSIFFTTITLPETIHGSSAQTPLTHIYASSQNMICSPKPLIMH